MKKKEYRAPIANRSEPPHVGKDSKGHHVLLCPFCNPSHPLYPGKIAICGTSLEIKAVQAVVRSKSLGDDVVCIKCGRSGGRMVRFGNGFIHDHDCAPGRALLAENRFSRLASYLVHLPGVVQDWLAPRLGRAYPVKEVLITGEVTDRILGYLLRKDVKNGESA